MHSHEAVLKVEHVSKSFGTVQALIDGCVELFPGEAHALLGENGAGKSTLVKILAGIYDVDAGEIILNGVPVEISSPLAARAAGIAVIYQEPTLFPDLSVAENIFMGRQPLSAGRRIDKAEMIRRTRSVFDLALISRLLARLAVSPLQINRLWKLQKPSRLTQRSSLWMSQLPL